MIDWILAGKPRPSQSGATGGNTLKLGTRKVGKCYGIILLISVIEVFVKNYINVANYYHKKAMFWVVFVRLSFPLSVCVCLLVGGRSEACWINRR